MSGAAFAVARGRIAAERLMTDTCTITRAGGEPVYDATTDTYTFPAGSTVYEGKCKVRSRQAMAATPEAGEGVVVVARRELHLPLAGEPRRATRGTSPRAVI